MEIPSLEHRTRRSEKYLSSHYPEFYTYIKGRYVDCSFPEALYLYKNKLDVPPTCPICGRKCQFINYAEGYKETCSRKCSVEVAKVKRERTCLKKYGVSNTAMLDSAKSKYKRTCLERYGASNALQSKDVKNKSKQTCLERYGVDNPSKCYHIKQKTQRTCLERYGVDNPTKDRSILERRRANNIYKYGVDSPSKLTSTKNKIKKTNLERYGVDNYAKSAMFRKTLDESNEERMKRAYETKVKNGTFNTSSIEVRFKEWLDSNNIIYKYQYRSDVYPFICDFYFPTTDTYLEINGMWTHGKHPYNANSEEDQEILNKWKSKGTEFYRNAIKIWTESDPLKVRIAKENNVKLYVIYSTDLNDILAFCQSNNILSK